MKHGNKHAGEIFEPKKPFAIPPYQRSYSWDIKNCLTLWDDLISAEKLEREHFLGTIVVIEKGEEFEVIDGQQRLTSLYLITTALVASYKKIGNTRAANLIINNSLMNRDAEKSKEHRIQLSNRPPASDRDNLKLCVDSAIDESNAHADMPESRITSAYKIFCKKLDALDEKNKEDFIRSALERLQIVIINLGKGDNPQQIFRSINATGKKLTGADMIRNHVLMGIHHDDQVKLYKNHWNVLDKIFSGKAEKSFDSFIRYYISIKRSQNDSSGHGKELLCGKDSVSIFEAFSDLRKEEDNSYETIDKRMQEIVRYADCYQRVVANEKFRQRKKKTKDNSFDLFFRQHEDFPQNGFIPFFMEISIAFEDRKLNEKEAVSAMQIVGSYIVRRTILKLDSKNYNAIGPEMWRRTQNLIVNKQTISLSDATARALFELTKASSNTYPSDKKMKSFLLEQGKLDTPKIAKAILSTIEQTFIEHGGIKPTVELEHVLPKKPRKGWNISASEHEMYVNHFGNLTLNEKRINRENSNKIFVDKRQNFRDSTFQITQRTCLAKESEWTTDSIKKRAGELLELFFSTWPTPNEFLESDHDMAHASSTREHEKYLRDDSAKSEQLASLTTWIDEQEAYCLELKQSMRCSTSGNDDEGGKTFAYLFPQKENLAIELPGELVDFKEICDRYNLDSPYKITDVGTNSSGCDWRIKVPWGDAFHDAATALLEKAISKTD